MFQFTWFDKKQYKSKTLKLDKAKAMDLPKNWVSLDKLDSVRTLYWEEHCLECSPPHCYNNCNHWQRRKDDSCVRFFYGIKRNHCKSSGLWGAEFKFRPWAKLESRINKGGVPLGELKKLRRWDNRYTKLNLVLSKLTKWIWKNYKFSNRAEGVKRKKYAELLESGKNEDTFILQCFSKTANAYNMCLEITNPDNIVLFRKTLSLQQGFNEHVVKIDTPLIDGGLIRLYPENDCQAELIIYLCDLVKLKESACDNIPKQPAKKVKCVAWDLDCTVWDGILIESTPDTLQLRENVLTTIKRLDERGIIQIIVSKNNEDEVLPQLQRLGIEQYFVYKFVNWNSKSSNLMQAAEWLNINVDTFALIDDSFFERNEVVSVLPCVRVYEENGLENLLDNPEFDTAITEESKHRREMYQMEAVRKSISSQYFGDNIAFLHACEIKLQIRQPKSEEELNRSFDLIHRTNQLNLSGKKYERAEFDNIINTESRYNYIVQCYDKYGSYGQVAFISAYQHDKLYIDEFAMSCRVANKYVESALMYWLQKRFDMDIEMIGNVTQRNKLLVNTFEKIGFENHSAEGNIKLLLPIQQQCKNTDIVEVLCND